MRKGKKGMCSASRMAVKVPAAITIETQATGTSLESVLILVPSLLTPRLVAPVRAETSGHSWRSIETRLWRIAHIEPAYRSVQDLPCEPTGVCRLTEAN